MSYIISKAKAGGFPEGGLGTMLPRIDVVAADAFCSRSASRASRLSSSFLAATLLVCCSRRNNLTFSLCFLPWLWIRFVCETRWMKFVGEK